MNIGGSEFLVIALLALFLFGPSLLAFWFGYILGQKKGEDVGEPAADDTPPAEETAERSPEAGDAAETTEGTHD